MSKIYVFYAKIPIKLFNSKIKYVLSNTSSSSSYKVKGDDVFILYGWTKKSDIAKEFKELRPDDVFTLKIFDSDDIEDIDRFSLTKEAKLDVRKYIKYEKDVIDRISIVSTLDEYKASKSEFREIFEDFYVSDLISDAIPPYLFKSEIWTALQYLRYTSYYYGFYGTDDEQSAAGYNQSFGLSAEGTIRPVIFDEYDQVEALLYLFKYFFYGKDDIE